MNAGVHEWQWEKLEEADSTNQVAITRVWERWGKGRRAEGLVVMARRQTAGRGQHGRKWESPEGGLYLSAVVENVPMEARDRLALVAGVAVAESLKQMGGGAAEIRWPNDLLVGGKKVAGILCEAVAQGECWAGVIGIGVNVLTEEESFPEELRQKATSLFIQDGQRRSLDEVAHRVVGQLGEWITRVRATGLRDVVGRVRELDALRGKRLRFDNGEEVFEAIGEGIDEQGRLLLRRPAQERTEAFAAGSVLG